MKSSIFGVFFDDSLFYNFLMFLVIYGLHSLPFINYFIFNFMNILPLTTSLAGFEMSVSLSWKLEAVTWHTQSPLSYWISAARTRSEQSPSSLFPAHSIFPLYIPTGWEFLSHLHSPFLLDTLHPRIVSPPGFTSVYPGCSNQSYNKLYCLNNEIN